VSTKIPIKIVEATQMDRDEIFRELSAFSMPHPRKFHLMSIETVFVAKHKGKIVGFISILPDGNAMYEISGLYTRLGFDRKGIGSKLLGIANSYFIGVGAKKVVLSPGKGRRLVGDKIEEVWAEEFYKRTNYEFNKRGYGVPKFEWFPKPNPRKRKPKTRTQKFAISPQNIMNPQARLRRRIR